MFYLNFVLLLFSRGDGRAHSVQSLATAWTVRRSNPGGGAKISLSDQIGPGAHPASYKIGTVSFLRGVGVKRPGPGVDHPSHI